jgi:hypothetical protein
MQYLVTATALKPTDDGHFVIVEIPRFILDSEIEQFTEGNILDKARHVMGNPKDVRIIIQNYNPKKETV